jgi:hypothetical protein
MNNLSVPSNYQSAPTAQMGGRGYHHKKACKCPLCMKGGRGYRHKRSCKCPLCKTVGYSKIAIEWITSLSLKLGVFIQHMENGGEYKISNSYKADGYSSELNCIFEFHGCHVHGCKSCYPN